MANTANSINYKSVRSNADNVVQRFPTCFLAGGALLMDQI